MVVGTLKILAAFASATTLFFKVWRSIDCTPNAICGCWSMKISWQFCGVSSSRKLVMTYIPPRNEFEKERLRNIKPPGRKPRRRFFTRWSERMDAFYRQRDVGAEVRRFDDRLSTLVLPRWNKKFLPAAALRPPQAEPVLQQLHHPGHRQRQRGEHDQAGEHHVHLIAAGGLHHHHAESGLRAEELRHHDAQYGAADGKPQARDDVGHRIRH